MIVLVNSPFAVFGLSLLGMLACAKIGILIGARLRLIGDDERSDLNVVLTSTLTLLGLMIGFSFSMVVNRYDERSLYEEQEANAIGTAYVRADLLPSDGATEVRQLLMKYLDQRIQFYEARDEGRVRTIATSTSELQLSLWSVVRNAASKEPTPVNALLVSGMNDVLSAQGYAQAAFSNRLPLVAWGVIMEVALFSNFLFGLGSHRSRFVLFVLLPLSLSVAFFLIAEIDSPREGLIRVVPQNLHSFYRTIHA